MNKVLICSDEVSELTLLALKEKYGKDVIVVTPEKAMEQGLALEDFANFPRIVITPAPKIVQYDSYRSGKQKRRERRAKNRKRI